MSLSRISSFSWDTILSKLSSPEVKKHVNGLRGKANDISANASKFVKDPAPIDFAAYKKKLKLTASAVDQLEAGYKSRKLPTYTATLPAFESKKRAATLSVLKSTVDAAEADLRLIEAQLAAFDKQRFTRDTSVGELFDRFPTIGKEVEKEINLHEWRGPNDPSKEQAHH